MELDVFSDHPDRHLVFRGENALHNPFPNILLRPGIFQPQQVDHELIQILFLEGQRQFVDRVIHVTALDHGRQRHVAKHRKLSAQVGIEFVVRAAHQHVGLDTNLPQLGDRLLRRLRLEFARRLEKRHQRHVNENDILRSQLEGKLPHRLQKRHPFDIAGRAANFGD